MGAVQKLPSGTLRHFHLSMMTEGAIFAMPHRGPSSAPNSFRRACPRGAVSEGGCLAAGDRRHCEFGHAAAGFWVTLSPTCARAAEIR